MTGFEALTGTAPGVFIGMTLLFMGGCALMTGQALAAYWRPAWRVVPYALLLGAADRFLVYALFHGELLSVAGYLIDSLTLVALALLAHRAARARMMVRQYPWRYERAGFFRWREREDADD